MVECRNSPLKESEKMNKKYFKEFLKEIKAYSTKKILLNTLSAKQKISDEEWRKLNSETYENIIWFLLTEKQESKNSIRELLSVEKEICEAKNPFEQELVRLKSHIKTIEKYSPVYEIYKEHIEKLENFKLN